MKIEATTRGWLNALFRQKRKFGTVFFGIVLSGLVYITFTKPQYEAAGSLLVKFGRGATPEIARSENSGPEIITQSDRRETIQSDMEILQSHALLYEIVHKFGAKTIYPNITKIAEGNDIEEAVIREFWKSDLVVKSNPQSNLIDVKFVNEDPQIAMMFVHELFKQFITRQSEVFNKPQTNFLEAEVKDAAAKLQKSQDALEEFKEKNEISSMDDEMSELLRQKSDAETMALDADNEAWERLSEMQSKEAQMRATYLPDSPLVARQHELVVLAQRQLKQHQSDQSNRIKNATATINKRIAQLEAQRARYRDLSREVSIDEENYKNYVLRSENARINDLLNRNSITPIVVVDEPVVPTKPIRPRKKLVMAMCLLAGLVLGTATALAFETLDPRFTSPTQISDVLGVPIMASFS